MNYKLSLLIRGILNNWILFLRKLPSLFFGLFLFSAGMVANLNSDLGMSPWGVLNVGITNHTYFSLGQATQIIGIIVLLIGWGLGFPPGFGTLMNMYFIGFFIDVIMREKLIPQPKDFFGQIILLGFSVLILGVGSLFYLSPKLGAGPRDGLMMGLVQKYNKTVAQVIIRWDIQKDVITIPKSSKEDRIASNTKVFDFELSDQDIKTIES